VEGRQRVVLGRIYEEEEVEVVVVVETGVEVVVVEEVSSDCLAFLLAF
jgi:hypothetical protein